MTRKQLDSAVHAGIISAEQAERLALHFRGTAAHSPSFNFVHVLYYSAA